MNYSNNFFGKSLTDLTWHDIESYFETAKEETDTIEYKSFAGQGSLDSKYEGIYKAACAFLNSNGGIIIWGSPVGVAVAGRKEKSFHGVLSPINMILEKDTVISKISSKITPMPEGINVKIIENGANCICVFEIQKSQYSPHQTNNSYYMRLDGQSVPAPHYFIEAMFRQVKYPFLEGYLKIINMSMPSGSNTMYHLTLDVYIFNESALQNETNVHFSLSTDRGTFLGHNYPFPDPTKKYWNNGQLIKCEHFVDVLHYGAPTFRNLTIEIPASQIPGDIQFILHFGGKSSPMKTSEYKCKIVIQSGMSDLPKCEMVEINENRFMYELPEAMNTSKKEKLRIILGR